MSWSFSGIAQTPNTFDDSEIRHALMTSEWTDALGLPPRFATGGDGAWFIQTNETHDGVSTLQSGGSDSGLSMTLNGPGVLHYWAKTTDLQEASSELPSSYWSSLNQYYSLHPPISFSYSLDDNMTTINSTTDWTELKIQIPAGEHVVRWNLQGVFFQLGSGIIPTAWLDDFTFTPAPDQSVIRNAIMANEWTDALGLPPRFATGGDEPWFIQTNETHDGISAFQSGGGDSWLGVTLNGPGILRYWAKTTDLQGASSKFAYGYNYYYPSTSFNYSIDENTTTIYSSADWTELKIQIPAGEHVVRWNLGEYFYPMPISDGIYQGGTGIITVGGVTRTYPVIPYPISTEPIPWPPIFMPTNSVPPSWQSTAWLDDFTFTPGNWPEITNQPSSLIAAVGETATISVVATGDEALSYQWLFNGAILVGETNTFLVLSNLQVTQAGSYSVQVSNALDSIESSPAQVRVKLDFSSVLTDTNFVWLGRDSNWQNDPTLTHEGAASVRSGSLENSSSSSLGAIVQGPGMVTFWWKVTSAYDVSFTIDGGFSAITDGEQNWQEQAFYLPEGEHEVWWQGFFPGGGIAPTIESKGSLSGISFLPGTYDQFFPSPPPVYYDYLSLGSSSQSVSERNPQPTAPNPNNLVHQIDVTRLPNYVAPQPKRRLFWQHSDGQVAAWDLRGTNFSSSTLLNSGHVVSPDWKIKGNADFNNDSQTDLLWQHSDGRIALWLMDSNNLQQAFTLNHGKPVAQGWQVAGVADMDGNGKTDIVWQHNDGRLALWSMDGTNFISSKLLYGGKHVGKGWRLVGIGDFSGNGSSDFLWRHSNGQLAVWFMDGTNFTSSAYLNNGDKVSKKWRVVGLADFNGDGQKDLLWQNSEGQQAVWFMNPSNRTSMSSSVLIGKGAKVETGWNLMGAH